ncbi:hypothetical protein Aab01nite_05300 [Paractinoplanes abujensis]|uniref:WD40 repeat protein n=1 Tax=Paractinoplanes abujensis TaxID=882441 RepID=A0A7W7CRH0_9ACTN|nr:WD40 repeat domain-containing protein [Actinoplanes abujensis]MBB4691641.1 WD40 repeat protein [Actinoplanes abujensis]GID16940.1 hypothetical protein Aab01nite_05300 [Actinoplanes abujensis]
MDDERPDPIRTFAERLRALQVESGGPSVRELVRLTEKAGTPYTRGTIHDKLAGRSAAPWEFVAAFVRACAVHRGESGPPDLSRWRAWHATMEQELAAVRTRRRPARTDVCPYRGLETFTAEHAAWFHGRAAAVREVLSALAVHRRGLLLLGPSGSGKSSLIQAGVLPALARGALPGSDRWRTVVVRPGKDLTAEVARAGLEEIPAGTRVLLVIDQFEELLTESGSEPPELGEPGLTVVVVMRDDFYPRLAAHAPDLLRALTPGLVNVPAGLSADDLRDIVVKPAAAVGLELQEGLAERIVTDLLPAGSAAAPVTVLPLLELTLHQLWHRREQGRLTHAAYQRIGGVTGAVTSWCDTAVDELTGERRLVAQRLLTALVRPADTRHDVPAVRQQVALPDLRALAGPGADEVLAVLTERRIVTTRTTGAPATPVAELVHEALIRDWATLRDWVEQDHRFQDWLRRAGDREHRWSQRRQPADLLLGTDLAEALTWSSRRHLPDRLDGFVTASHRHDQAARRRTRRVIAVLAGLLATALIATGVAGWQRRTAVEAGRTALSRQLAAQSGAQLSSDPDTAGTLAVRAYRESPTAEAAAAVHAAAALPLRRRLTGHTAPVYAVAVDPAGRLLATGGDDRTVRLWDLATGALRATLTGHDAPVQTLGFSPDGHMVATGGVNGRIRLYDIPSGRAGRTWTDPSLAVTALAFSPDGRTVATGGGDRNVRLWDPVTGRLRASRAVGGDITTVAISPDGRTLAVGGLPGLAELWTGAVRRKLAGQPGDVTSAGFSPDGRTVATAGTDSKVRLWDTGTGRLRSTLAGNTNAVLGVVFGPDGGTLATAGGDGLARVFDAATGRIRTTLTGHSGSVTTVAFTPDGRTLATGSTDHTARLWDVSTGQVRATLTGRTGEGTTVAFSPDGRLLATGSRDGSARLWDSATGRVRRRLTGHTGAVREAAFSPDGRTLATGSLDGTVRLWDVGSGRTLTTLGTPGEEIFALAYSPDGRTVATGIRGRPIRLYDVSTGQVRQVLDSEFVYALAFSPDGTMLAEGHGDNTWRVWDTSSGRVVSAGTGRFVYTVAFSPDGRTLATAGDDHTVRLWDAPTGRARATLTGHTEAVYDLDFSEDGATLVSGGEDGTVRLWDVAAGQQRSMLPGRTESVDSVALSPDGRTLAAGDTEDLNTVRLWDVAPPLTMDAAVAHICATTQSC